MKVLGLIPARGNSKGIPKKNIKNLCGKPLIAWTIEEALKSNKLDNVVVSTEDEEIADISKQYGAEVPFMRPAELAKDSTPAIALVLHAIEQLPNFDSILLLQPTSPLRTVEDISGIIDFVVNRESCSAVSVSQAFSHPFWTYSLVGNKLKPFFCSDNSYQRQLLPEAYCLNGALYFASIQFLSKYRAFVTSDTLGYVMPKIRSIDIDDTDDWQLAECFMKSKQILH